MIFFSTVYRRFLLASILWVAFWPILWYIKIGDITGPKAWFWIVGQLSYPVVAIVYLLIDNLLKNLGMKPWVIFWVAVVAITMVMPFYYQKYGFALGVTLESRYL
jgi:hypothetical protein